MDCCVTIDEKDFMPLDNLEAFLHIVHVSDMHCRAAGAVIDVSTEKLVRRLIAGLRAAARNAWADQIEQRWQAGLAGHDPLAHERMCEFLYRFSTHAQFGGVDTWLVDTGDLSALGDLDSLTKAFGWLDEYKKLLGAKRMLVIHGNHDAWPGRFPLFASADETLKHQKKLRKLFAHSWPHSIETSIPHGDSKLSLSAINSTTANRIANTLARGLVDKDPPWAKHFGVDQLARLAERTKNNVNANGSSRDFRILALHHPVHYPPPRPKFQMSLRNDKHVADELARFSNNQQGPLAHLILSGHTHETYPSRGELPPYAAGQQFLPLYEGQLQLIAGSLSQLPRYADMASRQTTFIPQQCQILTFFTSKKNAEIRQMYMERRVVGRNTTRPYNFLPVHQRTTSVVESTLWQY